MRRGRGIPLTVATHEQTMDTLESHPVPDSVTPQTWHLRVTGAVAEPLCLAHDELRSLPDDGVTDDFTCVEGWRAEELSWHGIRLQTVLARAAPTADAAYVLVQAMDGDYTSALSLARARDALLAFECNGTPLPVEHGGPARLVPGDDGDCWEHVKWVAELEVTATEPTGRDTAKDLALGRASTDRE